MKTISIKLLSIVKSIELPISEIPKLEKNSEKKKLNNEIKENSSKDEKLPSLDNELNSSQIENKKESNKLHLPPFFINLPCITNKSTEINKQLNNSAKLFLENKYLIEQTLNKLVQKKKENKIPNYWEFAKETFISSLKDNAYKVRQQNQEKKSDLNLLFYLPRFSKNQNFFKDSEKDLSKMILYLIN